MARYGCTITVQAAQIPSSQSNFVWLLTEVNFPTAAIDGSATSILNGGGNLRCYVDDTKAVQLPIEVVTFVTGVSPQVQVWGLSPTLANSGTVYIEADTVAISQPAVTDTYGRNAVYAVEKIRHHLIDNSATQTDSSGNDDGTLGGFGATTDSSAKIPPTNLNLNTSSWVEGMSDPAAGESHLAVRAWYKQVNAFSKCISGSWGGDSNMSYLFFTGSDNTLNFRIRTSTATNINPPDIVQDGTWHHLAGFYDGSTMRLFSDGVEIASVAKTGVIAAPSTAPYNFGRYNQASSTIPSNMQEHAVSCSTDVTVDYIKAEYNNQSNPAAFWSTGPWEDQDAGGGPITHELTLSYSATGGNSLDTTSEFNVGLNYNATGDSGISKTIEKGLLYSATGNSDISKTIDKALSYTATGTSELDEGMVMEQQASMTATGSLNTIATFIPKGIGVVGKIIKRIAIGLGIGL